jgi:hypothetical protein
MVEEILVPFASTSVAATQLRSTLITTSLQSLRTRGVFDRYLALVPRTYRDEILGTIAGQWLPMELGLAHYGACDQLGFSAQEAFAIGQEVGDRVQGTLLGVALRTVKNAGVTAWSALTMCTRLYERLYLGGAVQLVKVGPKEARMELVNNACAGIAYWKSGFRGIVAAGTALFASKTYVHELPKFASPSGFGMRVSWA